VSERISEAALAVRSPGPLVVFERKRLTHGRVVVDDQQMHGLILTRQRERKLKVRPRPRCAPEASHERVRFAQGARLG
jgi:hypothetical protein